MLAIGRSFPLEGLGLETVGVDAAGGRLKPDERLQLAPGIWVAGDPAGPELHTHVAHYAGEMVVRMALGDDVRPDFRAIPRATYTDPETSSVGLQVEEAVEAGTRRGGVRGGHRPLGEGLHRRGRRPRRSSIADRASKTVVGVFLAGPGASEAIHEAVLAVKLRTPLAVLADTIHAFPTLARVMGGVFARAARELGAD